MVQLLEEAGRDVATVTDEGLGGTDDAGIGRAATGEGRILIAFDVGFGNIRLFPLGSHAGVVAGQC